MKVRLTMVTVIDNDGDPGNTKYVLDGHWFLEIDGNC